MKNSSFDKNSVLAELRILKPVFEKKYGLTRLGLFGSAARNEMREDSDIDIVIEMKNPDLFDIVHMKEALEHDLNRHVDIIHYRENMNYFLKQRIIAEAVYV